LPIAFGRCSLASRNLSSRRETDNLRQLQHVVACDNLRARKQAHVFSRLFKVSRYWWWFCYFSGDIAIAATAS
jgi:hypothetical protein